MANIILFCKNTITAEQTIIWWLLKRQKDTIHQVMIKSQQNWLRQGVEKFALRSINLLILFGIRRNCLTSGRSQSIIQSIRRVITQIVVQLYRHIISANYVQNFNQHPADKVNSICRGNYWRSSMWTVMQEVNYWSYIRHLSNTWKKNGNTMKQCISSF